MKKGKVNLKIFKFLYVVFIFYSLFFAFAFQVSAQQTGLYLTPSLIEVAIIPGQSFKQKYKLANTGDPTLVVMQVVSFEPIGSAGETSLRKKAGGPVEFEIESSEITLGETFFMKNRAKREFELNIKVPEEASDRDYYYTLAAQTTAPKAEAQSTSARAQITLGSHLLITVTSDVQSEIKPRIALFEIVPSYRLGLLGFHINLIDSLDRVPIRLVVDNKGKNLITPRGTITMKGILGLVKTVEIKPQNVLAYSQKELRIESTPLSGFFLGSYQVSALVNFGEGTPVVSASTSFFAFPFMIIAVLLIAAVIMIIFIKKLPKSKDRT